jgi:predicted RNA binding protein YcfA (HicA-like mRNA interferase family)
LPKLPVISGLEAVDALGADGFALDRWKGSHAILWHPQRKRTVSVPVHAGEDLKPGTLRAIIRQAGLTVEEFVQLLR